MEEYNDNENVNVSDEGEYSVNPKDYVDERFDEDKIGNPNKNKTSSYTFNAETQEEIISEDVGAKSDLGVISGNKNYKVLKKQSKLTKAGVIILLVACIVLSAVIGTVSAYAYIYGASKNITLYENVNVIRSVKDTTTTYDVGDLMPVVGVVETVADSVVEITTEYKVVSVFYQQVVSGAGSGVIFSEDGYIVTNNHVIENSSTSEVADTIVVKLNNGETYSATLIGRDADVDIAVLKINVTGLTYAEIADSSELAVGETVIAVGNPLGELGGTVTSGIISGLSREISVDGKTMTLLQTDAAINPGNSGGGLFNLAGKLVGIVNAKSTSTNSGTAVEGIGFAVPSNTSYKVFSEILEYGYVRGKAKIGIELTDVTSRQTAIYYFNSNATGVYVSNVEEGYNDDVLQYGDRIITFDGIEITDHTEVSSIVSKHAVGDKINAQIVRNSKVVDVVITVYEKMPDGMTPSK